MKFMMFILLLLPICYVMDLLNNSNLFINYITFLKMWWEILLVGYITYCVFKRNRSFKYDMLEEMRYRHFISEIERYHGTPYIAPIMLAYLKTPPGTVRNDEWSYVNDTFYRTVVNCFRDMVYNLNAVNSFEPAERKPYLDVIGEKNFIKCLVYLLSPILWMLFVLFVLESSFLTDWPLFTLPLVYASFQRATYCIEAFIQYTPRRLDQMLEEHECANLKVTWRDAFPDREIGRNIIRSYYAEMERRQRYEMTLQRRSIPDNYPEWCNPNFAPFPYPSKKLPAWENEYEDYYKQKELQGKSDHYTTQGSNIVNFPKIH